jgi:hypothetical protein
LKNKGGNMGFEDIAYDLIKEYHASKIERTRKIEIAKMLAKKACLRFNFEWTSEKESDGIEGRFERQRQILRDYSQLFLDVAVEIYDILPDESERMKNIASIMKKGAYGLLTHSSNGITPVGDSCANKVIEFTQEIIE